MQRAHPTILALICITACSDPSGANGPAQLIIEPGGTARTIRIGTQEQLYARITGGGSPDGIRWTTSDSAIARIDSNGMLRIATTYTACNWVTPGECEVRITATSGDLRADQTLTVLPFEATLELNVTQVDLEMGDSARLTARVLLENNPVPWCVVSFTSQDSTIARLASGFVYAADEGSTIIDVTVSGPLCPRDAAHVDINNYSPRHTLAILPGDVNSIAAGETLQLIAEVTNWKGVVYPALYVQWTTSNPALLTVENGLVRAGSCGPALTCRATITARSGRLIATKELLVQ